MATYKELVKKARGMSLQLTLKEQKEIIGIYEGAIEDLSDKAKAAKNKSLTQRWTTDYLKQVTAAKDELQRQLNQSMTNSIKQAAKNAVLPDLALFKSAQAKAGIDIGPHFTKMFSQVPSDTLASIVKGDLYKDGKGLSQRIWSATNNLGQDIDYMIKKAMVEKKSAFELAKDLKTFVKPEHQRPWDWGNVYPNLRTKQIDYNAQRLARTSITHAHRESQHQSAAQNPFVDAIHWELSDAHYERQIARWGPDECDDYANQDWYGLGKGNFPPDEVPLSHPQCLCYTYPVITKSLDQIADELKDWVDGNNPELDRFFENDRIEINTPEFLKIKGINDSNKDTAKAIEDELHLIPKEHRGIIEKAVKEITIVSDGNSRYDRREGIAYILENPVEGEVIHELAHAIETELDLWNDDEFLKVLNNGLEDIDLANLKEDRNYSSPIWKLEGVDKFISDYQSRLYDKDFNNNPRIDYTNMTINAKVLGEYFSEGYREYITNPNNLRAKDNALFDFIKGRVK